MSGAACRDYLNVFTGCQGVESSNLRVHYMYLREHGKFVIAG